MRTDYISIRYRDRAFRAPLYVEVLGIKRTVECKIDTGCMKSTIPIKRLNISDVQAKILKEKAINEGVPYCRTYGISNSSDDKERDKRLLDCGNLMDCPSLRFQHQTKRFDIAGFELSGIEVGINYDREGNILIGMDILENWDIHIGKSKMLMDLILLACPYDRMNNKYGRALKEHFALADVNYIYE